MKREEKKPGFPFKRGLSVGLYFFTVLLLTFLLVRYIGQRTVVIGSSMESTLSDGDNLIVDKISYRLYPPKRYDIIVFPYEQKDNTYYIKRIIGLPGETVRIDLDGTIYIDGGELEESYGREVIKDPGMAAEGITLNSDEYFVLGDNRNNSCDSRDPDVGILKSSNIIGRALIRVYPFDKIKLLTNG